MYDSGALNKSFLFEIAITEIAPGKFFAAKFVPSKGSTQYQIQVLFLYQLFLLYITLELHPFHLTYYNISFDIHFIQVSSH